MKQEMLTNEQVCSFCTALEQMIRAGIGLGDALVLLKEDEQDARCRQMLEQMARRADEGATLSAVIRETERFPSSTEQHWSLRGTLFRHCRYSLLCQAR